jgi:lipopolysaccharide transport system permease protein
MNPTATLFNPAWIYAGWQLAKRDFLGRYKKSVSGVLLAYADPLVNLAVFSVIFGVFFNARFRPENGESHITYTLAVFSGVLLYEMLAEILTRSPGLIAEHPTLVQGYRFPHFLLPVALIASKLCQFAIAFPFLLVAMTLFGHPPGWNSLQIPLLLIPLILLLTGFAFLLSAIGHFFRDIVLITQPLRSFFLYASAVFYNRERVPEAFQFLIDWNPLATIVIQTRSILFWNDAIDWRAYFVCVIYCALIAVVGITAFQFFKRQFTSCV